MGLFTQEITLELSNPSYVIEKIDIALKKSKINLYVKKGTTAYVGGTCYKGSASLYEIDAEMMGGRKKDTITAYLCPDKTFDTVSIKFFAGKHKCSISYKPDAKADFSILGEVEVMINDYSFLCEAIDKTITKDELIELINNDYRKLLGDEISQAADRFITQETTENDLNASLNKIVKDVFSNGRRAASQFQKMGLIIMPGSINLTVEPFEDADEMIANILNKINQRALDSFDEEEKEKEYQPKKEKLQAERDHEINIERAKHTTITEQKTDINKNGDGNVVIEQQSSDKFCIKCGKKIARDAAFCPSCGAKQE